MRKELARVESVKLYIEDHGILTCFVNLKRESWGSQGFGGYQLDVFDKELDRMKGSAAGMDWILQILQIFSVNSLDEIEGKMCYALYDEGNDSIMGIETLSMDGGKTFKISDWQKQWFPKEDES